MRFLADECLDHRVVAALRAAGHDIRLVADGDAGADDRQVVAIAQADRRILLTEDKDHGELVVRRREPVPGLVLLRLGDRHFTIKARRLLDAIRQHGEGLAGRVVVIRPNGTASRPLRAQS